MNDVPESAKTQRERILSHLRLAAMVHGLRQLGWQIEKRMVEVPTRDGRTARVAEYRMEKGV